MYCFITVYVLFYPVFYMIHQSLRLFISSVFLEKQQQLNCFSNMEIHVHPLFKTSMAQNSLMLISLFVYKL